MIPSNAVKFPPTTMGQVFHHLADHTLHVQEPFYRYGLVAFRAYPTVLAVLPRLGNSPPASFSSFV
jgi:hypothetical protein